MEITYQHHSPHIDITSRFKKYISQDEEIQYISLLKGLFFKYLYSQVYPFKISFQSNDSCLISLFFLQSFLSLFSLLYSPYFLRIWYYLLLCTSLPFNLFYARTKCDYSFPISLFSSSFFWWIFKFFLLHLYFGSMSFCVFGNSTLGLWV